jgi:hypothetical protein
MTRIRINNNLIDLTMVKNITKNVMLINIMKIGEHVTKFSLHSQVCSGKVWSLIIHTIFMVKVLKRKIMYFRHAHMPRKLGAQFLLSRLYLWIKLLISLMLWSVQ